MLSEMRMPYSEIKRWVIERKQQRRPWTIMIDIHDQHCGRRNLERDLDFEQKVIEMKEEKHHLSSLED